MTHSELVATLALTRLPKIGCITARKLIRYFGSATAVFEEIHRTNNVSFQALIPVFKSSNVQPILDSAKKEVEVIETHNIRWVTHSDATFPASLNQCSDAPLVLFYSGKPFPITTRIVSVVGTRQPSSHGKAFIQKLVASLAPYQPIIVSGFAYGVDIEAQLAALEHGLSTYACLAHGILQCYPKQHNTYRKRIEESGGFLTEYWTKESFQRTHFLQRNRIIAGLAQATIVVESRQKGGALTTAQYALGYQRDVLAIPGRPTDLASGGCIKLIKNRQAECITNGEDVARILGWGKRIPWTANKTFCFTE